ncbi:MAG: alpha/beta hydrolase [Candidatus Latescibacterota bacterium]
MTDLGELAVREYGTVGHEAVVLHGGPGAAGSAEPVARGLADSFHVIEPWQRGSGDTPLTVHRHILDLQKISKKYARHRRPALVGESWGAMLALAYVAEYPVHTGRIVLIGCGTFDTVSRGKMNSILEERMDEGLRKQLAAIADEYSDPAVRLQKKYELTRHLYLYDSDGMPHDDVGAADPFDVNANKETWDDMIRLQDDGLYPAAFSVIQSPLLMIHGEYDPHPGEMIRDSLLLHLPQLEYHQLKRCGHSPWLERAARDEFFALLKSWLVANME